MKYGIGPTWMHSVNCMIFPTIACYPGLHTQPWDKGSVMLRFLYWGIGFYVYEKEGKK